jgi:hypothetical protein
MIRVMLGQVHADGSGRGRQCRVAGVKLRSAPGGSRAAGSKWRTCRELSERRFAAGLAWLSYALLAACSAATPAPGRVPGEARSARPEFRGWMLAPEQLDPSAARITPDGRRAFLLRGTRWLEHPDGAIERGRQVFEQEDVKAVELPAHLGGGFVFYANSGNASLLWRADDWLGDLRPLGRVEPPVSGITSGFDRLYLSSAASPRLRALDPVTGDALDLSPLPPAAAYGDMVFSDAWTAVVLAGIRGALCTFDAGETWYPLPTPGTVNEVVSSPAGAIILGTDAGRFELDPTGRLLQTSAQGKDALFGSANTFTRYAPEAFSSPAVDPAPALRLGPRPLRAAVLRGWPDTPSTAVVIDQGVLGRVRLADGKPLSAVPYTGQEPCRGLALGRGFGFVCGGVRGPTQVYSYASERLRLELTLAEPHAVRSSGNGALIIDAACAAVRRAGQGSARRQLASPASSTHPGELSPHCARFASGELLDVEVPGELGSERITALSDGRVAVLIPPRADTPGRLSVVSRGGTTQTELHFDEGSAAPAVRLVRSGLWLDEFSETDAGRLGSWVVGARAFVGVHVDLNGTIQIGRLEDGVEETSFSGRHALQIAASASLRETTDYGAEWRVAAMPAAVLAATPGAKRRRPVRGCSELGCVYGDWVRVGYADEGGVPEPARPEAPARVRYDTPPFAFWALQCEPTSSPRSASLGRQRRAAARARASEPREPGRGRAPGSVPESSAWFSFQGELPPERRAGEVGYDFGETNENGAYRAYTWGPPGGDWQRRGLWQLWVGDRFSTASPWSTRVTRSPWPDAGATAQLFGLDPNTGVDWWLRLGATGRSGVLQIRVRSESSLHLIERDRPITTLELGSLSDIGAVSGAYQVGDRWYLGVPRAEQFQLYRVDQNRPRLVASYPLWGRVVTQLIGSVHADGLALWQRSSGSGWYVYPIDLETFEAQPALYVPNERLGLVPPPCEPGRPGWIGAAGVPLTDSAASESNTHLDFAGAAEGLRTKRLTARIVIDESGICVDALAALTDGPAPHDLAAATRSAGRKSLPLTVTDPADERRWAFRCTP